MLSLILAGEAIFLPVFHLGRYFKSSMLATFEIDEFMLGQLGAIYGVFAMASYFLGGPLADRWSPKKLIAISLVATALGSVYMATLPGFGGLCAVFAFWGVSTILVFWAPLIRSTSEWAIDGEQGRAFGILDAGRGLTAAAIASSAAFLFTWLVGDDDINPLHESASVQKLVLGYAIYCGLTALCVWAFVPDSKYVAKRPPTPTDPTDASPLQRVARVLRWPAIWLQSIIILAAYSAFKMFDNYGLYSEDAFGLSRTESARLIAYLSFLRFAAALAAGWIADRGIGLQRTVQASFGLLVLTYAAFLVIPPHPYLLALMVGNMAVSCVGFFALRGIYFALVEDTGVPHNLTGTAVGVISFVGFTPEIYMGPLTGWLIREAREAGDVLVGYRQIFTILALLAIGGMLAAFALRFCRMVPGQPDANAAAADRPHR